MNPNQDFHTYTDAEVAASFRVNLESGLDQQEATRRTEEYGENAIEEAVKTSLLNKFMHQFSDVMVIVLLVAAILA